MFKINLQFFAADEGTGSGGGDGNANQQNSGENQQQNNNSSYTQEQLDRIVDERVGRAEKSALKSFFQQQGMSEEEATKAMKDYKDTKDQQNQQQQNTNTQLQTQYEEAQKLADQKTIECEATKTAMELGIDAQTLPYVLKMADLSNVKDKDGKISSDNIKAVLNKVLEDIPALKPVRNENKGFQIGGGNGQNQQQQTTTQVPTKRWNRFNN